MLVDPAISRAKFAREVAEVTALRDVLRRRGAFIISAEFPEVFVALGTPNSNVSFLPFGAVIDFSDYDLQPPSVRFVNPYTKAPLQKDMLRTGLFLRAEPNEAGAATVRQILQCHDGGLPFLCLAGIREYHESSAHSGDSWWLHRGGTEGKLFTILDLLCKYGTEPIASINFQISLGPFAVAQIPT